MLVHCGGNLAGFFPILAGGGGAVLGNFVWLSPHLEGAIWRVIWFISLFGAIWGVIWLVFPAFGGDSGGNFAGFFPRLGGNLGTIVLLGGGISGPQFWKFGAQLAQTFV